MRAVEEAEAEARRLSAEKAELEGELQQLLSQRAELRQLRCVVHGRKR